VGVSSNGQRRLVQLVFQIPDASLNPRAWIMRILRRPVDCFFPADCPRSAQLVTQALDIVRLKPGYAGRCADLLSGGERQRVATARALLARYDILICDDVLSALCMMWRWWGWWQTGSPCCSKAT